jgi:hypothetical protein
MSTQKHSSISSSYHMYASSSTHKLCKKMLIDMHEYRARKSKLNRCGHIFDRKLFLGNQNCLMCGESFLEKQKTYLFFFAKFPLSYQRCTTHIQSCNFLVEIGKTSPLLTKMNEYIITIFFFATVFYRFDLMLRRNSHACVRTCVEVVILISIKSRPLI